MQISRKLVSTLLITCLFISFPTTASAQSDPDFMLTTTPQLQNEDYVQKIEQFYDNGTEGSFRGRAGIAIYYKIFRQVGEEKGAIMISSGRTEAALKYKEVIFDLFRNGYSVYIHDHRGQGLSGRMTDDPGMGYIDTFQFYVDDMKLFYEKFVMPGRHEKICLLAHSTGGAIGMSYLEQYPDDFDAAAFSSPMLGLKPPICFLARILKGKKPKYGPGQSGYSDDSTSFEGNSVTGSEIRYHRAIAAYSLVPRARLGGASTLWVHRSCLHMKKIFQEMDRLETPFLLFSADHETVVDPRSHHKFVQKALEMGKNCQLIEVENAQHELLMEKDPQRSLVLEKILDFYAVNRSD